MSERRIDAAGKRNTSHHKCTEVNFKNPLNVILNQTPSADREKKFCIRIYTFEYLSIIQNVTIVASHG